MVLRPEHTAPSYFVLTHDCHKQGVGAAAFHGRDKAAVVGGRAGASRGVGRVGALCVGQLPPEARLTGIVGVAGGVLFVAYVLVLLRHVVCKGDDAGFVLSAKTSKASMPAHHAGGRDMGVAFSAAGDTAERPDALQPKTRP